MSDILTNEQIDALDKYGDEPEIFAHARAANAEIARLRNDVHGYMNQVGVLTSQLEEAREAGRKVVDIWLKTDDSYVNFGSLMLDLQEAVIADTKQSLDGAHHHRQRGRDSDMKCPSCGALAEVPGHYSWCEIQPPDSAPEERERRTPEWYASEQVKAHELEGACQLARDLGYATGHADTYDDLLAHVREQRNEEEK